jgi:DNA primase
MRASASLRQTTQGSAGRLKTREAALLVALIRHPRMFDRHAETLSELELTSPDLGKLRTAAIDAASHGEGDSRELMEGAIARAGLSAILARAEAALTPGLWWAGAEADDLDAETGFLQALALHQRAHALNKELRAAEAALGLDTSEENFSRLQDIQHQLNRVDGTEAMIEGFGAASGRPARSF